LGFKVVKNIIKNTFLQALRRISDDYKKFGKNMSYSIIKNFIIKLFYWLDESMSEILKDWNENSLIKVIADNVTKEQEYLYFLHSNISRRERKEHEFRSIIRTTARSGYWKSCVTGRGK